MWCFSIFIGIIEACYFIAAGVFGVEDYPAKPTDSIQAIKSID